MGATKELTKAELRDMLAGAAQDNIDLLGENKQLRSRLDMLSERLDEAVDELMKVSSRLINAKNEYRKLRVEYEQSKNEHSGIQSNGKQEP